MIDVRCCDALEGLRAMPDESVQCVVTSPPYYAQRDYAVAGQIGLEGSLAEYLARIVMVFAEVRRVMRRDGILFLNIGDSWSGSWGAQSHGEASESSRRHRSAARQARATGSTSRTEIPRKNLIGVPWRVAFALQDLGYVLRHDVIWEKPNPGMSSVKDRPTLAHEYVFILTREPSYYYDSYAVRSELAPKTLTTFGGNVRRPSLSGERDQFVAANNFASTMPRRFPATDAEGNVVGANLRDVWTFAPDTKDKTPHPAKFPVLLAERCVLLGTSARGCCAACGAPLERRVVKGDVDLDRQRACGGDAAGAYSGRSRTDHSAAKKQDPSDLKRRVLAGMRKVSTRDWVRSCSCGEAVGIAPCIVLDPFCGSGTTGVAAIGLGRQFVGLELNPEYVKGAKRRIQAEVGILAASMRPPTKEPST